MFLPLLLIQVGQRVGLPFNLDILSFSHSVTVWQTDETPFFFRSLHCILPPLFSLPGCTSSLPISIHHVRFIVKLSQHSRQRLSSSLSLSPIKSQWTMGRPS